MCSHCGCYENPLITRFMHEHEELVEPRPSSHAARAGHLRILGAPATTSTITLMSAGIPIRTRA